MESLDDFFSIIGDGKVKEEKRKKDLVGDIKLDGLFSYLETAKKEDKEEKELLEKSVTAFKSFLFDDDIFGGKSKPEDEEVVSEIVEKTEELVTEEEIESPKIEEEEVKTYDDTAPDKSEKDVVVEDSTINSSIKILDKLKKEKSEEVDPITAKFVGMEREIEQLKKMLYETIQKVEVQGGGGEVNLRFLDDVDTSNLGNNKVLSYNSSTGKFVFTNPPGSASDSQGYFHQNSSYFSLGNTHVGNPDVIEDVESDTLTTVKFTNTLASESSEELPSGIGPNLYDRSTGAINLVGLEADQFILVRINCDVDPDVDESQALIVLECQSNSNNGNGPFTFEIEGLLVSMDQGTEKTYAGLANVPIFIGDDLRDDGVSVATITPKIKLINTTGDIKPRTITVFIWK